mgnify:CR=1 FL=1
MKRKEYEEKLECLTTQVAIFNKQIEELKNTKIEEDNVWRPNYEEEYYYIDANATVDRNYWIDSYIDEDRLNIGNVFKTRKGAGLELGRLLVLNKLKKYSCEFRTDLENYYMYLDCKTNNLCYAFRVSRLQQGEVYFESEGMIRKAIKEVGEKDIKKYLFGIEY